MEEKKFIVSVNEKAKNNLPPEELKQIVNCIQSFWRIKFVCPFCGSNDVIINFYIRPEDFIFELEITCLGCKGITEYHMFSTCVRVIDRIGDIDSMIDRWYQRIKYYHYLKSALPERFALEVRARNEGNNVFLDDEARAKNCMITVSYNENKGKWTEDYRDEDEAELNHCRCGGIAVMVKIVMEFGAYEVYDDYLYIVECPICGRRTRPYKDSNAAVCEWNGVEYTPHVETGRQRTEEEKECDKMLADLPDPMTSALKLLSEKKEFVGGDVPEEAVILNRVIYQHDIDCANRLKRLDKVLSALDFSKEWFDDIEKEIKGLEEVDKGFNLTAIMVSRRTIGYLQELKGLKLALAPVIEGGVEDET